MLDRRQGHQGRYLPAGLRYEGPADWRRPLHDPATAARRRAEFLARYSGGRH